MGCFSPQRWLQHQSAWARLALISRPRLVSISQIRFMGASYYRGHFQKSRRESTMRDRRQDAAKKAWRNRAKQDVMS
ncbi:uncharacterized [Tachysurus ichikawai]